MVQPILAIECSSRRGSVAVADGPTLLHAAEFAAEQSHAVNLFPTIDTLCRSAGWQPAAIQQVYVSIGPGSFTGLRMAVTAARHLALALGAKLVAVPSLAVVADNAWRAPGPPPQVGVILDAKRQQVFAAAFERRGDYYESLGDPVLTEPAQWLSKLPRSAAVMGEGVAYHAEAVSRCGLSVLGEEFTYPRAESVHRLGWCIANRGEFTAAASLVPLYIRRPEAEELWEARHANSDHQ